MASFNDFVRRNVELTKEIDSLKLQQLKKQRIQKDLLGKFKQRFPTYWTIRFVRSRKLEEGKEEGKEVDDDIWDESTFFAHCKGMFFDREDAEMNLPKNFCLTITDDNLKQFRPPFYVGDVVEYSHEILEVPNNLSEIPKDFCNPKINI
jgi:hypothetical protein